ncbi:MAG: putative DNA-binding domain-containing protein [Rhodanobacteraceae bacterium]|nr:putative DNA-binding domain-containing protein [Xanthomonadales bacterium]MCP5479133.1 putative DNA-binding domain-containing protein [Rhodanobacteraceae bacterium]HPF72181.1 putative DNA-binding domain-containing protein [Xanthomonadaceae bacterium]HRX99398.1 putative DNA-binding domain-containing protein [Xanthomonadaceae bacterium]
MESLSQQQAVFAGHLRDPRNNRAPEGIEDRRLAVYRELFFNNIEGLLSANFPVIRSLFDDPAWRELARDFYREHRCQTPLFPEVAKEFLRYLEWRRDQGRDDPDFLLELAHYEWVELALSLDDSVIDANAIDADGDLLESIPVMSPHAWPLAYRYAVHRIGRDAQPQEAPPAPTFLLVVRDAGEQVRFKEINDGVYQLLQALADNDETSGRELLSSLVPSGADPDAFINEGAAMLRQLRERDVILGTQRIPS